MDTADGSAAQFQAHRAHLRAVAYRMLGSLSEADDAVQETWLRLNRSGDEVANLRAWLTTVVSRVCLDMLRSRVTRHEEPLDVHLPDPVVTAVGGDPEEQAVLADSVGLALLVVLDTLSPAERLAFVLHDIFAVPFERIGSILDRSPAAAKQLASRARRRLSEVGAPSEAESDPARHQAALDAFLAASQQGDFAGLVAVLDPDVVLRADVGAGPFGPSRLLRGASEVAAQAMTYAPMARFAQPVLVNGAPGHLIVRGGRPLVIIAVTSRNGKITEINILADPDRLDRLGLEGLIG
ncbi:MAG TPA: sigma-70 family RNA polymerase sigma factor [Trebonia sp.]|nr:sigma-70 family RNA polymerase sigma factor [Trebonia sp.]